jgi:RecA/RadA recombinase
MTAAVQDIPRVDACPPALRDVKAWLCWRLVQKPGEKKPRKLPFYPGGGAREHAHGSPEDRAKLVTFAEARTAAITRGHHGVGFCPLPGLGIVALDFDGCVDEAAQLHPEVEQLVAGTYAERSPSGRGVRAFFRGDLGNHKDHGEPFGFEVFSSKGYVTVTGDVLDITEMTDAVGTIADVTLDLVAYCEKRFGRAGPQEPIEGGAAPLGLPHDEVRKALATQDPDVGYDQWLRFGMAVHHETTGEGFDIWDEWSSRGSKYPGRDHLEAKWDSFGRGNQRPTTVHALLRAANQAGAGLEVAQLEADDFDVVTPETVAAAVAAEAAKPLKFKLMDLEALLAQKPPRWLVKDVVPEAEMMVIFGESGSGKTFAVLDIFAAVARGVPWFGQRTRQGRVIYIAAEGRAGVSKRVRAYCEAHGVDLRAFKDHFAVIADTPNLLTRDDAAEIVRTVGKASVIIVDTLAQTTPGANENAADDMGKALANCKAIHRATGALVVLVHHTGKDQSRGARGWSGLKAAADAELEVSKTPAGRQLRVSKQKDGEDGRVWGFELDQVTIGQDEDGHLVTSCVVREVAAPVKQKVAKLGKWQRAVHGAVAELGEVGVGLTEAEVLTAAIQVEAAPEGRRDRRAEYARDALADLVARGDLELADGRYRIA